MPPPTQWQEGRRYGPALNLASITGFGSAAGMGDGRHGFHFPVAHRLTDGRAHTLSVRVAGTDVALRGGPVAVAAALPAAGINEWINLDLGRDAAIVCALVEAVLTTHPAPYPVLVLRSSAAADPHTRGSLRHTLGWRARHPRAADLAFVTPADAVRTVVADSSRRPGH